MHGLGRLALILVALGGGGYDRAQRSAAVNTSAVLACPAILLFALGLLLDSVF